MSTSMPKTGSPAFLSIKQAAWILGMSQPELLRAIHTGAVPSIRRRSRLVVPMRVVTRLLGEPIDARPRAGVMRDERR
ncbi:helix-turn-helix domain-containing protein [Actinophytocola sp.]|uniref:helix-turn-helix domain-containing protein n=1 Tax=Actinophytocola sp. TaxID=1872138 RepID=UPI003D6B85B4